MLEILSRRRLIRGAAGASLASLLPGAARAQSPAPDAPWQVSPEARLRELGDRAVLSHTAPERVEVLGDIWATCAACHAAGR